MTTISNFVHIPQSVKSMARMCKFGVDVLVDAVFCVCAGGSWEDAERHGSVVWKVLTKGYRDCGV